MLKTVEQRAAEKALMDKSPLKTLTLEDFLESERHKLSGTLTPVTPETFAKWKQERLDKKAAEDEARKAKEATGRAMFEKGDWDVSESESDDDDDDDDEGVDGEEDGDDGDDAWNLEALRRETERAREKGEEERIRRGEGVVTNGVEEHDEGGDDDDGGASETNGINGHEEEGG